MGNGLQVITMFLITLMPTMEKHTVQVLEELQGEFRSNQHHNLS